MTKKSFIRMIDTIVLIWWAGFISIRLFFPKSYPPFVVPDIATILIFVIDNIVVSFSKAYEPKRKYRVDRALRIILCVFPAVFGFLVFGL